MHNIPFDESQHRVVHSHRVPTLDVHVSFVQFEEWVIMSNVRKNPTTLANGTREYAKATSLSVRVLIAKDERMAKELQVVK